MTAIRDNIKFSNENINSQDTIDIRTKKERYVSNLNKKNSDSKKKKKGCHVISIFNILESKHSSYRGIYGFYYDKCLVYYF